jgi:ADP-ribose pyrophosphatase
MNDSPWRLAWSTPGERLIVEAKPEDDFVRHRTRTNSSGDGSVVILTRGSRILFVEVERPAVGRMLVELPRGQAETTDAGEISTARRELREETGQILGPARMIGRIYPESGLSGDSVKVVVGEVDSPDDKNDDSTGTPEYTEQFWLSPDDVRRSIAEGSMRDGITLSALALHWSQNTREGRPQVTTRGR